MSYRKRNNILDWKAVKPNAEIQYDSFGRMDYHPAFHESHWRWWKVSEEQYLVDNYVCHGPEFVSMALGRTIKAVTLRAAELRRAGKLPKGKRPYARRARAA